MKSLWKGVKNALLSRTTHENGVFPAPCERAVDGCLSRPIEDHFRVDLAVGAASQHGEGSSAATHVALAWELRPQLSLELWFGSGRDSAYDDEPDASNAYRYHGWVDRTHGAGVRYDFAVAEDARWHPFFRTGWARVRGTIEQTAVTSYVDETHDLDLVPSDFSNYQVSVKDDAPYLVVGSRYDIDANWSLSAQILHIPANLGGGEVERTEGLIGLSYAF